MKFSSVVPLLCLSLDVAVATPGREHKPISGLISHILGRSPKAHSAVSQKSVTTTGVVGQPAGQITDQAAKNREGVTIIVGGGHRHGHGHDHHHHHGQHSHVGSGSLTSSNAQTQSSSLPSPSSSAATVQQTSHAVHHGHHHHQHKHTGHEKHSASPTHSSASVTSSSTGGVQQSAHTRHHSHSPQHTGSDNSSASAASSSSALSLGSSGAVQQSAPTGHHHHHHHHHHSGSGNRTASTTKTHASILGEGPGGAVRQSAHSKGTKHSATRTAKLSHPPIATTLNSSEYLDAVKCGVINSNINTAIQNFCNNENITAGSEYARTGVVYGDAHVSIQGDSCAGASFLSQDNCYDAFEYLCIASSNKGYGTVPWGHPGCWMTFSIAIAAA